MNDDEREAERIAYLDARQAAMQQDRVDWYADYDADPGIAGNAFERGWGAAVDGRFARHPEPQGEPSNAQVNYALSALRDARYRAWREITPEAMRAALRAAGAVGREARS